MCECAAAARSTVRISDVMRRHGDCATHCQDRSTGARLGLTPAVPGGAGPVLVSDPAGAGVHARGACASAPALVVRSFARDGGGASGITRDLHDSTHGAAYFFPGIRGVV